MGTTDKFLESEAKRLKLKNFRGVFMSDELPKKPLKNECGIVNLESSKLEGSHWCCWWKHGEDKYYFDSYGILPSKQIVKYLKSPINYSTFQLQTFNDSTCGEWCLYMLNELNKGNDYKDIILKLINKETF